MTAHLIRVEDRENDGTCTACGREGLRWIAIVWTGSETVAVGTECAKPVLGWKPATKSYGWVSHFTPVAEHVEDGATYTLWQHRRGASTRETRDGVLTQVGGVRADWIKEGWL